MSMDSGSEAELHWQAYRYVADEMNGEERALFEEQLDDNQPAREAVAAVVRLTSAVRILPASAFEVRPTLHRVFARAGWVSLGVAATLLFMFATRFGGDGLARSERVTTPDSQERQVALTWVPAEPEASDEETSANGDTSEEAEELETPSWLMAALTGDEVVPPTESEVN